MTAIATPGTDTTLRLTPEQVLRFHREGFLTLDRITPSEDVQRVRELLDGLFDRFDELPKDLAFDLGDVKLHNGTQKTPQINLATRFEPRLMETQYFRNAKAVAQQLLGPDVNFHFDHAIYKPPHNGRDTPWHQDMSYGARDGYLDRHGFSCNFWMPLQDTSLDMGCMEFIPHSHLGNLKPHHPVGHDPKVHTLETDGISGKNAVKCPLPAGGVTIHQPKTLHYTGPNNSDKWRRAWILVFGYALPEVLQ
jgi:hypothetical protein